MKYYIYVLKRIRPSYDSVLWRNPKYQQQIQQPFDDTRHKKATKNLDYKTNSWDGQLE